MVGDIRIHRTKDDKWKIEGVTDEFLDLFEALEYIEMFRKRRKEITYKIIGTKDPRKINPDDIVKELKKYGINLSRVGVSHYLNILSTLKSECILRGKPIHRVSHY